MARYPASLNNDASVQKFTGADKFNPNSSANDSNSLILPDAGNAGAINPDVNFELFSIDSVQILSTNHQKIDQAKVSYQI